jgi:hypothetical protein
MAQIFISYRRQDSAYLAATLSDKLQQHFGPNSVFFDIDNIPLGVDFREYIGNAVGQCDVLLVIIGDQWMGKDAQGKRRIDDPSDYVRIEIESALKRNIPVIPVLVEEATMPSASDLPPSLESISFRNAAEIRAGRDLRQHIELLITGLERIVGMTPGKDEPPRPSEESARLVEDKKTPREKHGSDRQSLEPASQRSHESEPSGRSRQAPDETLKLTLLKEIKEIQGEYPDSYSHVHVGEVIPAAKLANAIVAYAPSVSPQDVLLLFDNTVFGGAKDGLLLSGDAVYWHNISTTPGKTRYADIQNVEFLKSTSFFAAAKVLVNGNGIDVNMGDKNKLAEALTRVIRHLAQAVRS